MALVVTDERNIENNDNHRTTPRLVPRGGQPSSTPAHRCSFFSFCSILSVPVRRDRLLQPFSLMATHLSDVTPRVGVRVGGRGGAIIRETSGSPPTAAKCAGRSRTSTRDGENSPSVSGAPVAGRARLCRSLPGSALRLEDARGSGHRDDRCGDAGGGRAPRIREPCPPRRRGSQLRGIRSAERHRPHQPFPGRDLRVRGRDPVSAYGSMHGDDDRTGRVAAHGVQWAESSQGGMGAHPWDRPLRYVDNSPVFFLDRIRTPVLLIAGGRDHAVPWLQSGDPRRGTCRSSSARPTGGASQSASGLCGGASGSARTNVTPMGFSASGMRRLGAHPLGF
jgi:hypothetical protein